VGTRRNAVDLW